MLLIDALYINNSGGFRLLNFLTTTLVHRDISFFLLADSRCRGRLDYCEKIEYMKASMKNRCRFYHNHRFDFSLVFCFGNMPVPVKMQVPVYTYFHNINLLTLSEAHSKKALLAMWLKRQLFRHFKHNTDYWLVQTLNTAKELCKHLKENENRVMLMPFYELPEGLTALKNENHGDAYVYIANYTGAKGHEELLEAWRLLHRQGIDKTLHLTVKKQSPFCIKIEQAQKEGVNVVNHGFVSFEEVIKLYQQSKAIIYPSHNESLGLGIIEAIEAGCDVIGADLPYIHTICQPSLTFNPYDPESIAFAVAEYEKGAPQKSALCVENRIEELIDLLTSNK